MVHVIASIYVLEGKLPNLLKIYETFVPKVHTEEGCVMYLPTVDTEIGLATQKLESDIVTVIEKWESIDAFKAHISMPHSVEFRENIKGIVDKVSVKVLESALPNH